MGHCGTLEHKSICIASPVQRPRARVFKVPLARYNAKHGSHCSPSSILLDWAEQCLVIGNIMENRHEQIADRHYHEPVMPHSSSHGGTVVSVIFGLFLFALLAVGIIEARQQIAEASVIVVYVVLPFLLVLALASLTYPVWHGYHMKKIERQHAAVDLQAKQEQVRRENEAHQVQMYLAQSRLLPDVSGNYPAIFNPVTYNVVQLPGGNFAQNVPAHYAPHFHYQDTSTRVSEEKQGQLASGVQSPTMEYIISQLRYNSLQVCLGVSLETGKPFTMDLIEGTHYRIMGGSGFGKSCEAAAILEQVTQSNDQEHLLIALLDLEHKTSRLFEELPHVAALQIGRKQVDCVATSPDEVAQMFGYLRSELDRRKALSEYDLERERFMLIYVEEFLSLRREVDPELVNRMYDDFSILALRGRKYGLYLLACAQVDYSSKDLREAMNQFNVNMSFAVKPSAARAAGFASNDLLKANFEAKQRGQFVLETTGCSDILLAPQFDVKAKLQQLERARRGVHERATNTVNALRTLPEQPVNTFEQAYEQPWEAKVQQVRQLREQNWGKIAIIEKIWQVKRGGTEKYKQAEAEYEQIVN